jgi:hypothetical protein
MKSHEWVEYPKVGARYYHYKGGLYEVLSLATHTETKETMVVYKSINFGTVFVRPLNIWNKPVDDQPGVKRFEEVKDPSAASY